MSESLRHECPVSRDRDVLFTEGKLLDSANLVRQWYLAWQIAWDHAVTMRWVTISGSPLWREATRQARLAVEDADPGQLISWIAAYAGIATPAGWLTPTEEQNAMPF